MIDPGDTLLILGGLVGAFGVGYVMGSTGRRARGRTFMGADLGVDLGKAVFVMAQQKAVERRNLENAAQAMMARAIDPPATGPVAERPTGVVPNLLSGMDATQVEDFIAAVTAQRDQAAPGDRAGYEAMLQSAAARLADLARQVGLSAMEQAMDAQMSASAQYMGVGAMAGLGSASITMNRHSLLWGGSILRSGPMT